MSTTQNLLGFLNWLKIEHKDKKSLQDTYNEISKDGKYDDYVNFSKRAEALKKMLVDYDFTDKNVLDLACGTGAFISAVIDKNPAEVVGVDLTQGMLAVAQKRFANQPAVKLINSSFMTVDLPPNHFDYILLANAARYIPSGQEAMFFGNVDRWLAANGTFIILSDIVSGKIIAPLVFRLLDNSKANTNTAFAWNLEKELVKYFSIIEVQKVGWALRGIFKHHAFFCKKTPNGAVG